MFKISKIFKLSGVLLLLLLSFLITDSKANAQSCDDSWTTSTRGCKTDCMKDGLFCFWDEGKSWADSNTNSCVVESTTACPADPSNGSYAFSCNTNDCVLSCDSGYTKCGTSCVLNDPLPANCTSYNQCTDTCTSCTAGYTLVGGVCEGVSLKLANDSVASGGNIIQSSNPIFYINPTGNVGISTSTPQSKLHLIGGAKMSNLDGSYRVPVADIELVPRKYVDDNFAPITGGSGSAFLQGGNSFGTTATLGTKDAYNLDFITASSTRMTIDASGNVGIGTTSPVRTLDAFGNVQLGKTGGSQEKTVNIAGNINFEPADPPTSSELLNIGLTGTTGGTLTPEETYYYNVLYYTDEGETTFGGYEEDVKVTLATDENAVELTNVPTSDDPRVVGRYIYRSDENKFFGYRIYKITNNEDTTFIDTGYSQDTDYRVYRSPDETGGRMYYAGSKIFETGEYNTFTGKSAGGSITSGHSNAIFGSIAGQYITTGSNNNLFGYSAGTSLRTGDNNQFIGYSAGSKIETGSHNVGIGSNVLRFLSSANGNSGNNVGIGNSALCLMAYDVHRNIALGYKAGYEMAQSAGANNNIFIGYRVANDVFDNGDYNILIGSEVDTPNATTDYFLNIGDTIYGDLEDGNVGIGTTTPQSKLHVIGAAKMSNLDGSYRVPVADTELVPRKYVDDNFAPITGGSGSAFLQGGNSFGTIATLGTKDAYNLDFITSSTTRMTIDSGGNIGIGTTTPSAKLHISDGTIFLNDGGNSVYIGDGAGINDDLSDNRNVGVGHQALLSNTTGYYNTASGMYAGRYIADGSTPNETGNNSLFLGYNTKANADGEANQIVIGYEATGIGSNSVVLGNDSIVTTALKGNVGIGTTNPIYALDVNGIIANQGNIYSTGNFYTSGFVPGGYSGSVSEALISTATQAGGGARPLTYASGSGTKSGGYHAFSVDGSEILRITKDGNVGIGTTTPQSKLHVIGAAKMSNLDGSYRVPVADTELVPRKYVDDNFVSTAGGSSATFVGLTTSTYNGNQGGYESVNTLCSNEYADSHVCSTQEIYNTINLGLISSFPAGPVTFWLNSGPPGYKANVNDCTGWKSSSAGFYGAVWVISGTTFSSGIDECFETRAFACCSSS